MPRPTLPRRARRASVGLLALIAGFGLAALAGMAIAKTFTLNAAQGTVKGKSEGIVVNGKGRAVYTLSGDSAKDQKCTKANGCWAFWIPVTVKSGTSKPTAAPGIKGKLGILHRTGKFQVTLSGHPLYTFVLDKTKDVAGGEAIASFNGVWHVVKATVKKSPRQPGTTTSTTSTTTTQPPYTYPMY